MSLSEKQIEEIKAITQLLLLKEFNTNEESCYNDFQFILNMLNKQNKEN